MPLHYSPPLEELTIHHVAELAPGLLAAARSGKSLQLDLGRVSRIDSAGVQLLLQIKRFATRSNTRLALLNPSPAVSELLGFYRLGSLLGISLPVAGQD